MADLESFNTYIARVKQAINLDELARVEDDYFFQYEGTEEQNRTFTIAVDQRRKELIGIPSGDFTITTETAPPAPTKARTEKTGQVKQGLEYGFNYTITSGREIPPFSEPAVKLNLTGSYRSLASIDIEKENIFLVNIPPKDITFYLPHIRNNKLYLTDIGRATELALLLTHLVNFENSGGQPLLHNVYRAVNHIYPVKAKNGGITVIETMILYPEENLLWKKAYSYWQYTDGEVRPVEIIPV
ncbi:MAG: hypothetical protein QXL94_00265 [Candidatus Parvarchaeum sp.]